MNLFRTILIFSTCIFSNILLVAQNKYTTSIILNQSDSTIISHAHIINTASKIGVISNKNGSFSIQAKPADTLLSSFVGFEPLKIRISEIESNIYLERAIQSLESYTVLPYKNFNEFKEAFISLEKKDTSKFKLNTSFVLSVNTLRSFVPKALLTGKITNFASLFNKHIKDRKHYESLLRKDKYKAYLGTKYNSKIVKQTTTLPDESQINSFIEYCDFSDQFIASSSHYILVDQIINCFEEYTNLSMINK